MDKRELQDQELEQVSGGLDYGNSRYKSKSCGRIFNVCLDYPEGYRYKVITSGCNTDIVYKCPNCGDEF